MPSVFLNLLDELFEDNVIIDHDDAEKVAFEENEVKINLDGDDDEDGTTGVDKEGEETVTGSTAKSIDTEDSLNDAHTAKDVETNGSQDVVAVDKDSVNKRVGGEDEDNTTDVAESTTFKEGGTESDEGVVETQDLESSDDANIEVSDDGSTSQKSTLVGDDHQGAISVEDTKSGDIPVEEGREYLPDDGSSDGLDKETVDGSGDAKSTYKWDDENDDDDDEDATNKWGDEDDDDDDEDAVSGQVGGAPDGDIVVATNPVKSDGGGEWANDDDEGAVSPSNVEPSTSSGTLDKVGGASEEDEQPQSTNNTAEDKLETEIEIESSVENGDLIEEQTEELEPLDEGVSDKKPGMAIVGLTRDENMSAVEVPLDVQAALSSGEATELDNTDTVEEHSFDNLLCKDDPESYLDADDICESIRERDGEGCATELFSVDTAVVPPAAAKFDGTDIAADASNNSNGDILRIERTDNDADDLDDEERRLIGYDEDDELEEDGDEQPAVLTSDTAKTTPVLMENKIVVTIGNRYCPATCDAVSECERARDYFNRNKDISTADKSVWQKDDNTSVWQDDKDDDDEIPLDSDTAHVGSGYVKTEVEQPTGGVYESSGAVSEGEYSKDAVSTGEEGEDVGQEVISEGKVADASCADDPEFLYKGQEGATCVYIGAAKPDRCEKLHNGEKVGIVDCPVSCGMVAECEQIKFRGVDAPSDDADDDGAKLEGDIDAGLNPLAPIYDQPVSSQDTSPSELLGDTAAVAEVSCEDDSAFLYKDQEGWNCAYIGQYKPDRCDKLNPHTGENVGVISCPVSCNMVEQCKNYYNVSGAVMSVKSLDDKEEVEEMGFESRVSVDSKDVPGNDMNDVTFGEATDADASAVDATSSGNNVTETEMVADNPTAVSSLVEEEKEEENTVEYEGTGQDANEWSAGSEDELPTPTAAASSEACKDDPNFLYKDKEGWTCAVIGELKADKCEKLNPYNGVAVGLKSCPESCKMVVQCMEAAAAEASTTPSSSMGADAAPSSSVGLETGAVSNEEFKYNKPGVEELDVNEVPTTTEAQGVVQSLSMDEEGGDVDRNSGDTAFGSSFDYVKPVTEGSTKGTKSMADALKEGEFGGWDQGTELGNNSLSNDLAGSAYNSIKDDEEYNGPADEGLYDDNDVQPNDDMDSYNENANEAPVGESNSMNDWEDTAVNWDQDKGEGVEGTTYSNSVDTWKDNGDLEWEDEEDNGWNKDEWNKPSDEWEKPSDQEEEFDMKPLSFDENIVSSPTTTEENPFSNVAPTNNVLPSEQDNNAQDNAYDWELDDDGGFPVSIVVLLIAMFALFVYKKFQNSNSYESTNSRDCTSRGGYQPVGYAQHGKKW